MRIGADPLGGASVAYWGEIAERHGLDLTVVNPLVDPTWRFMTLDWDGKIRMDCSSPSAMASLIGRKDEYDIATGNDADADRHGIVTPDAGLMNPNHYLAVAIQLPLRRRPAAAGPTSARDRQDAGVLVDDRPGRRAGSAARWSRCRSGSSGSCPGLIDGSFGFGGEESAGASFLRRDGTVWTTDKDGIILALLASEILAATGKTPEPALRRADRAARRPGLRPRSTRPADPRAEGQARRPLPRRRDRHRAWPASRSPPSSPRRPATARRSAASR